MRQKCLLHDLHGLCSYLVKELGAVSTFPSDTMPVVWIVCYLTSDCAENGRMHCKSKREESAMITDIDCIGCGVWTLLLRCITPPFMHLTVYAKPGCLAEIILFGAGFCALLCNVLFCIAHQCTSSDGRLSWTLYTTDNKDGLLPSKHHPHWQVLQMIKSYL